jgi:hypothetical protein
MQEKTEHKDRKPFPLGESTARENIYGSGSNTTIG